MADRLNLRMVPPVLRDPARDAFAQRDALGLLCTASNTEALRFVFDNLVALRAAGMYEPASLEALIGTRTNHEHWTLDSLRFLLSFADQARLQAAGDPLPGSGPCRLYRGVAGEARHRKARGLHWTSSPNTAAWFARCFSWLADPAVYVVDVPGEAVLAYVRDRGEDDYLVALVPGIRPRRLPELPEPIRPRSSATAQEADG